jgi:coproporphyrinogen III oxidase-like Fe-S oxidoreductase
MLLVSLLRILLTRSFKPFVFKGRAENRLDFATLDDLGLYVHIPFCRSLCGFCPYCKELYDPQKAVAYRQALLKEIDFACWDLTGPKLATSLYFGGGTPALMIDDLQTIIDRLHCYFTITGGIGVELHPSDIRPETLHKLQAAGVTMVSIGIQSFHEICLEKLGRRNDDFIGKLELVRTFGFEVVDVDLIFAIPGQTDEILANEVLTAFAHGATQVSTYPFIDFTFADNQYKPLPEKVKKRMLRMLVDCCHEAGLERTSVWTFGKPGAKKYSSVTRDTFLGFGLSATTLLKDNFKINTFSLEGYIERVNQQNLPTALTLDFTQRQRAAYYLFWAAYRMRIDSRKFAKIVGAPLLELYGLEIFIARMMGYLRQEGDDYKLTDKAASLYHRIEQVYTTAYIDKMWNIARKQAFPEQIVLR